VFDLEGKRVLVRPAETKDLRLLYTWRNQADFIELCSARRRIVGYEEFVEEFHRDLDGDRHIQCVIERLKDQTTIGTVFSYNLNLVDGFVFVTIFVDEHYRRLGYSVEAMALFLDYLFTTLPLHKIYMEVYGYNDASLSVVRRAGFAQEACFKEHRYLDGKRHDLFRFALFRDKSQVVKDFLARLRLRKEGG